MSKDSIQNHKQDIPDSSKALAEQELPVQNEQQSQARPEQPVFNQAQAPQGPRKAENVGILIWAPLIFAALGIVTSGSLSIGALVYLLYKQIEYEKNAFGTHYISRNLKRTAVVTSISAVLFSIYFVVTRLEPEAFNATMLMTGAIVLMTGLMIAMHIVGFFVLLFGSAFIKLKGQPKSVVMQIIQGVQWLAALLAGFVCAIFVLWTVDPPNEG